MGLVIPWDDDVLVALVMATPRGLLGDRPWVTIYEILEQPAARGHGQAHIAIHMKKLVKAGLAERRYRQDEDYRHEYRPAEALVDAVLRGEYPPGALWRSDDKKGPDG